MSEAQIDRRRLPCRDPRLRGQLRARGRRGGPRLPGHAFVGQPCQLLPHASGTLSRETPGRVVGLALDFMVVNPLKARDR